MKKLILVILLLCINSIQIVNAQNANNNPVSLKSDQTTLFGKDIVLQNLPERNQRLVSVCSAFNGWLYAVYSYISHTSYSDFGALVLLKSVDNGITWDVMWDAPYPLYNSRFTCLDIIANGNSTSNLKIYIAAVISDYITGVGDPFVIRYNGITGDFESQILTDNSSSFIAISSDFNYPAINANPYSLGVLYSKGSIQHDSIIFCSSDDGGQTLNGRRIVSSSAKRFQKVSLAYGKSFSRNSGRYFAVWEEKNDYTSNTGKIYTAHSEPNFNSAFTLPLRIDSINLTSYNNAKNPSIACQYNSIDNDSADLTEVILFDKYLSNNKYDIVGLLNKKATSSNHFTSFSLNSSSNNKKQSSICFNNYDSTFMATYFDSTELKLPFIKNSFNMSNPGLWQNTSTGYNDSSNISTPYPLVRINFELQEGMNVWIADSYATTNGIAMFDAPYSLYNGVPISNLKESDMEFHIFPNPCNNILTITIELNSKKEITAELIDIYGRILGNVFDKYFQEGNYQIQYNVSVLPQGTYFLIFKDKAQAKVCKLIIAR